MRQIKLISLTVVFFFSFSILVAQNSCLVLKPSISASYIGSCKQGLADGMGEAKGEDYYKGEFAKGLPDGKGTYIWKTGEVYKGEWKKGIRNGNGEYIIKTHEKDSVIAGKWKDDKYIGKADASVPYSIDYRNSIGRVSCIRVGERPYVKYVFSRNGSESNNISNLLMQGSSGSESTLSSFTGFEQVTFPFKGKVTFSAPSSFQTSVLTCELRLTIKQPGSWIVTIFY